MTVLEDLERDGYVIREGVFDPAPVRAALEPILAATPHGQATEATTSGRSSTRLHPQRLIPR